MAIKVMVVEDYEDNRVMLTTMLGMKGYQVVEAVNGREAVNLALNDGVGLILMDLNLPVLDGYEATREIVSHPKTRHIPVVAVSAQCGEERRQRAFEVGCIDCVQKPIDFAALDQILALVEK